jgi:ribosomal protein L29
MKRQVFKPTGKDLRPMPGKPYTPKGDAGIPKAKDINQMSSDEIRENLLALKFAQMSLNAKKGQGGAIENVGQIRNNRRTIARMMTVLVQRGERCV